MSQALRTQLRSALREVWATPEAETLRTALSASAQQYGRCLARLMEQGRGGRKAFEECAKRHNVKTAFKGAWGKPTAE